MRSAPRALLVSFVLFAALIAPPPALASHLPEISIDNESVTEGDSGTRNATFTVTLSDESDDEVTVDFETEEGTADSPSDFESESGTVEFDPGDTSESITISVVGDTRDESNETFFVQLSNPDNATIEDDEGTGTIIDDDGEAPLRCTITGTEGNDDLEGTSGDDVICGRAGNDTIDGMGGDDILRGGNGQDELDGGDGDDILRGGNGRDDLEDDAGDDDLRGGTGPDSLDSKDSQSGDTSNGGLGPDDCEADPGDTVKRC